MQSSRERSHAHGLAPAALAAQRRTTWTPAAPSAWLPSTSMLSALVLCACGGEDLDETLTEPIHWSYSGEAGPEAWGELHEDWEACGSGSHQSPVSFPTAMAPVPLDALELDYASTPATLVDNGHTMQLSFDSPANVALVDGESHELLQLHFHADSEHRVAGQAYPLEMHLVHESSGSELAVLGVFFEVGAENQALGEAFASMPSSSSEPMALAEPVELEALLPDDLGGWAYSGSLTTPPCSEGVRWHVYAEPLTVSEAQLQAFAARHAGSNRPVMDNADVRAQLGAGSD